MFLRKLVLATALLALTSPSALAGGDEVVLVKQVSVDDEAFELPDRTIELQLKRLRLNEKAVTYPFALALQDLLATIEADEWQHRTVVVGVTPTTDARINVIVNAADPLEGTPNAALYYGDWQVGRLHALVVVTPENKGLLKQMFKQKDKLAFVREFIRVEEVTPIATTSASAVWTGTAMQVSSLVIDDEAR